jgi:hypothetical protein
MPLESVAYISDLVATNPVNATDQVAQGDDHLRNIKLALLNTFPNITGAMTATHGELNQLAGSATAAGMVADIAALTDPNADRILFWDDSAGAVARLAPSTGLTISGTDILIDTAVVPRLGNDNTFTGANNYFETVRFYDSGNTDYMQFTHNGTDMLVTFANTTELDITGTTLDLNFTTLDAGPCVVSRSNLLATEVGYAGIPRVTDNDDRTLVLSDAGQHINYQGAGGHTITIPANSSVAFPQGTSIRIANFGGAAITIAITTDSMLLAGVGTTGSRTLARYGLCELFKIDSTAWTIFGPGVS